MQYITSYFSDCKVTLIYPAVEKHIEKYSQHEVFVVRETPDMYRAIAEPCMQASKFSLQVVVWSIYCHCSVLLFTYTVVCFGVDVYLDVLALFHFLFKWSVLCF